MIDFNVLLFVPAALEVLAEIKKTPYTVLCRRLLQLELSHNGIENKICNDLATTLYYF